MDDFQEQLCRLHETAHTLAQDLEKAQEGLVGAEVAVGPDTPHTNQLSYRISSSSSVCALPQCLLQRADGSRFTSTFQLCRWVCSQL